MKKLLCLSLILGLFLVFNLPAPIFAQTPPQKMIVDMSDLTPDQIAKINAEQELRMLEEKIETYGKWVGVGSEVGTAIRDGLFAVKDVAVEFGNEDVGKFTMMLIA